MGEIFGLGLTHLPPLLAAAGDTASRVKRMINDPLLPERYRSPATWPRSRPHPDAEPLARRPRRLG
jgi:hypothetical protein